jgi:hypothetical protein
MARVTERASDQDGAADVGTLWTMRRDDHTARCALFARADEWEVRVLVDGDTMLRERCARSDQAFAHAETWKGRLAAQSWRQIIPARPLAGVPLPL